MKATVPEIWQPKSTWEETYREMAAADEDWSEWETADGLAEIPWKELIQNRSDVAHRSHFPE